jgi:hypothetical protein
MKKPRLSLAVIAIILIIVTVACETVNEPWDTSDSTFTVQIIQEDQP